MNNQGWIYFLFEKGVLSYIGATTNIIRRAREHLSYRRIDNIRLIKCEASKLRHYETRLIKYFKPFRNSRHNDEYDYKIGHRRRPGRRPSKLKKLIDFPKLRELALEKRLVKQK